MKKIAIYTPKILEHRYCSFSALAESVSTENSDDHPAQPAQQANQKKEPFSPNKSFNSFLITHPALLSLNTEASANTCERQNLSPKWCGVQQKNSKDKLSKELHTLLIQTETLLARKSTVLSNPFNKRQKPSWNEIERSFLENLESQLNNLNEEITKESRNQENIEFIQEKINNLIKYHPDINMDDTTATSNSLRRWRSASTNIEKIFNKKEHQSNRLDKNNSDNDQSNYLNTISFILDNLFFENKLKLIKCISPRADQFHISKNIIEYILKLDEFHLKITSSIAPHTHEKINPYINKENCDIKIINLIDIFEAWGSKLCEEKNNENIEIIVNYLNFIDNLLFRFYNFGLAAAERPNILDLSGLFPEAIDLRELVYQRSREIPITVMDILKDRVKEESLKVLKLSKDYSETEIDNCYQSIIILSQIQQETFSNPMLYRRIEKSGNYKKYENQKISFENRIENLKKAYRNLRFIDILDKSIEQQ